MSTTIHGTLFDGDTLAEHPGTLLISDRRLLSLTDGLAVDFPMEHVRISDRLGSLPRSLYLPDGRTFVTPDNAAIDALLAGQNQGRLVALVHWLEGQAKVAALATLLLAAALGVTVVWALPVLARQTALAVPDEIETRAGQTALRTLNQWLAPSQLTRQERTQVQAQLDRLLQAASFPTKPKLVYYSMGGQFPNAFALPGGFIVVSDELVRLATTDELTAVLAHEIAHWQLRHGLQSVLRNSAALLVVSTVTGDLSTLTTFAGTIPFILLRNGYSREFETEADAYAVDLLRRAKIDPVNLASILGKLEKARPEKGNDFTYLSTHPSTTDRIQTIRTMGQSSRTPQKAILLAPATMPVTTSTTDLTTHKSQPSATARPQLLSQVQPEYPHEMALAGISGKVTVEFVINEQGVVTKPTIVKSSHREFEAAAIAAISQSKYIPGRKNGQTVAVTAVQSIEFKLDEKAGQPSPAQP